MTLRDHGLKLPSEETETEQTSLKLPWSWILFGSLNPFSEIAVREVANNLYCATHLQAAIIKHCKIPCFFFYSLAEIF